MQWRCTSSVAQRSSGEHKATGTGTQGGGEPGAKKINPRAISSPGHKNMFLLPWPAMRAHPSWQRPLSGHIFFSLFFFSFFVPSTHADSTTTLTCFTLPRLFKAARFAPLRSTNNYRNSSNNYQHRDPARWSRGRGPAGRPRPGKTPPPPPANLGAIQSRRGPPDLKAEKTRRCR